MLLSKCLLSGRKEGRWGKERKEASHLWPEKVEEARRWDAQSGAPCPVRCSLLEQDVWSQMTKDGAQGLLRKKLEGIWEYGRASLRG